MRKARFLVLSAAAGVSGILVASVATASGEGSFTLRGTVSRVVDGDTVDVTLTNGKRERVRVIGIDAAETGTCYAAAATARTKQLTLAKQVVLRGDATQDTRDRYGRLLAYVDVAGTLDLGRQLVLGGFAAVYVYKRNFVRLAAYETAQQRARTTPAGSWATCSKVSTPATPATPIVTTPTVPATTTASTPATTTATTPTVPTPTTTSAAGSNCHPSYPTVCIPPPPPDLDCKDVPYRNFPVVGADPHRFDGNDNDGRGCES